MSTRIIITLSTSYTSSLMPKIISTTTPTTARDTPASNNVTVPNSVSPIKGNVLLVNVCVKKNLPLNNATKPVVTAKKAPTAATTTKFSGKPLFTVSTSNDK